MRSFSSLNGLLAFLAGVLCLLLPFPVFSEESYLNQALIQHQKGNYKEALQLYDQVDDLDRIPAEAGAFRTRMMIGEYQQAEQGLRELLPADPENETLRFLLSDLLGLTGRSEAAIRIMEPVVRSQTVTVCSLVQFGKLLDLRGRSSEAETFYQQAITYYDRGLVFDAREVACVAEACRLLGRFQDANSLFRGAVRIDPGNLDLQVLWGDLFREKYNLAEARRSYQQVLEKNGRHVPALVGMARVTGGPAARAYLKTALDINPYSVPGRVVLAGLLMEDGQYDEAADQLNRALQVNPESLDALAKLAAMAYLRDDYETFRWLEGKVAALSPGNGDFYTRVAEACGRNYRFAEAVDMAAKAVSLDAGNWNGHIALGLNLLRLGREEQGRQQLETGFRGDPFHVWAMNMLSVLDAMDGFETRTTAHFVVRMDPEDAVVVWPYLKSLLEECWQRLTIKYGCQLSGPTLIEVFPKQEDFAVRTSGLPDIGHLLGVCFGSVITLSSPKAHTPPGSINWQEVVWHEFAHVITLQMTNNRIPRWLSEGVSVYEESRGRPEWGRRQDIDLVRAVQGDRLIRLDQLDAAFSKAKDLADLNFAYYQSSLLVAFIVEHYGFSALKTLIRRYADDISQSAIFEAVFNVTEDDLQTLFFTWLQARSRKINIFVEGGEPLDLAQSSASPQGDARLSSERQRKMLIENLENRIKAQPRDFLAQLQLGLLLHAAKENKSASRHLTAARDLLPNYSASPNPREILAAIYEERGDLRSMERELEALAKIRQNAFEACFRLGQIAWRHDSYDRAVYYLERALAVNPYAPEVHRLLGTAALQRKNYPKAVREFEVLLALDQNDPAVANTNLAEAHLRGGDKARAKQYALAALEIAPLFERAQDILLDAIEP